jgi:hypothetical protein
VTFDPSVKSQEDNRLLNKRSYSASSGNPSDSLRASVTLRSLRSPSIIHHLLCCRNRSDSLRALVTLRSLRSPSIIHHLLCCRNRSDSLRASVTLRSLRFPSIIHHLLCFAVAVIPFGLRLHYGLFVPLVLFIICSAAAIAVIPFGLRLHYGHFVPLVLFIICSAAAIAVIHNNRRRNVPSAALFGAILHCFVHCTCNYVILLFFCQLDEVNGITRYTNR